MSFIPIVVASNVLLIDDRENPKVIAKLLMRMGDAALSDKGEAKVKRLKTADYLMGAWGIEAKEINDLYRSILGIGRSRTIIGQLRDLERAVETPMLVVYGTQLKPYVGGKKGGRRTAAIEIARMKQIIKQFKMTFYQRFPKFRYMEFLTMDDFVEWLVINHTQINVNSKVNIHKEILGVMNRPTLDNRVEVLSTVEGVSQGDAERLLQKFGSLPKILHSRTTQKSLMEVEGIGRVKAKNILRLRKTLTDMV